MRIVVDGIEVEVTRKKVKNINLRVLKDGRVTVSAPHYIDDARIERFVRSKADWIRKNRAAMASAPKNRISECKTGDTVYVWGEKLRLVVVEGKKAGYKVDGQSLILNVAGGSTKETRLAALNRAYKEMLESEAGAVFAHWESRTGLHCREWRTKRMKTRWGSCNSRERRIWLNTELAKYPKDCLSLTVLHELAHLKAANHGPEFYAILDRHMPIGARSRRGCGRSPIRVPAGSRPNWIPQRAHLPQALPPLRVRVRMERV